MAVLTAMEAECGEPSSLVVGSAWRAPVGLAPLPAALEERARCIIRAQDYAIAEIEFRLAETSRHLAALDTIPARPLSAAYLDVTG